MAQRRKKILGITGIRSDYDLMSSLYRRLATDPEIDMQLLVGGAHLSRSHGHTIDMIQADGVPILVRVESLIDGDTVSSRLKSGANLLSGAIDIVAQWAPDVIIYAGDREEVWIGALLGSYLDIPTVHFYGGDHTLSGYVDNPVRHATSKLSTAHFVQTEVHKARLLALGEPEARVFVTGNLSLDNFASEPKAPFAKLQEATGFPFAPSDYALVLFHPIQPERDVALAYLEAIFAALRMAGLKCCVGYPNSDPENSKLAGFIERQSRAEDVFAYRNLFRSDFISLYRNARLIIGNSSSGILEAASIPIPAIDIGTRQRGRQAGSNVVFCAGDVESINRALAQVLAPGFLDRVRQEGNPYGDGHSTDRAIALLKSLDLDAMRYKGEDPLGTNRAG